MNETAVDNYIIIMFGFFINQLHTNGKKLYQKVIDLYKKCIRLEMTKTYFEVSIKHNLWPHFTNYIYIYISYDIITRTYIYIYIFI